MIHAVHELVLSLKMYLVSAADLFIHRRLQQLLLLSYRRDGQCPPAGSARTATRGAVGGRSRRPSGGAPADAQAPADSWAGRAQWPSLAREEAWQDRLNGGLGETAEQRQLPGNWGYSLRLPRQAWPPLVSARPPLSSWRVLRLSVAFLESERAFLS